METTNRTGWGAIRALALALAVMAAAVLVSGACSGGTGDTEESTADASPTSEGAVATEAPTAARGVKGVTFVVGEGSEATFTVEEKLASLSLPNDAVMRTTGLSGEVHLDGRPSVITIDLQSMVSDQPRRDQFVRGQMFPNDPAATFTLDDTGPLPDGFLEGDDVTTQITGRLAILGAEAPVAFEIEARHDGDVVFIVGRTMFEWAEFGMTAPNLRFVQVTDEVHTEVLLAVRPASS